MIFFYYSVAIAGVTASANDYTVANGITFTFTPTGPSRQFFSFTPVDDDRVENNEIVLATLSTTDPQAVITRGQIQITIEDDDGMFIGIFKAFCSYNVLNMNIFGIDSQSTFVTAFMITYFLYTLSIWVKMMKLNKIL